MTAASDTPKRLPILARLGLIILVMVVAAGSCFIGFWLTAPARPTEVESAEGLPYSFITVVLAVLGILGVGAGILLYVIVLSLNCFIRDVSRPFFSTFKTRVYLCQIVVPMPFILGLGLLVAIPISPFLRRMGIDSSIALLASVMGFLVVAQIPLMWLQIWAPVEKSLIRARLHALGVGAADLGRGWLIGISDPGASSLKKLTLVEDDMGMLWITTEALIYIGDTQWLAIRREQLQAIEQKADA